MQKLVFLLLVGGVALGSIMPSKPGSPGGTFSETSRSSEFRSPNELKSSTRKDGHAITLDRADDGHFYADVKVNGQTINFLIDTGASGIALSREDAQRASIALPPSMDEVVGRGASGDVRGEYVTLDRIELGQTEVRNANAVVLEAGDMSLLGQSFLSEFGTVTIEGDRMVLR